FEQDICPVQPAELGTALARSRRMAIHAIEIGEELLSGSYRRFFRYATEPFLKLFRLHDDDPADHSRVIRAAVLRAKEVILTGTGGLEPHRDVSARQHVLLHAERGNIEAVDDVLGCECQLDRLPQRDMKLIDLPPPF